MKKLHSFISISGFLLITYYYCNYFRSVEINTIPTTSINNPTMCFTKKGPTVKEALLFDPYECELPPSFIRKNVNSLTLSEVNALKAGITAMKALPVTDKTSWAFQANIHGTVPFISNPSWNACQHGTQFFLSWHRMYIYFFERILRSKSGNPNFALPYWNYQIAGQSSIPLIYRSPSVGNPLYHARNASMNSGATLPSAISTSITSSLSLTSYYPFQSALEGPHGSVHVSVGGQMGNFASANDPLFWAHHANIDRLWVAWLRKCGGRANPTNAPWLNQIYTFYDENGLPVNMTGSQIINTVSSLNYKYDFPFMLPCNFNWFDIKFIDLQLLRLPKPFVINKRLSKLALKESLEQEDLKNLKTSKFRFTNDTSIISDQVFLELVNYKITQVPEGVIEVYINLPAGVKPNSKSNSFASVIDLFTAFGHSNSNNQRPLRIDITEALRKLKLKPMDMKSIEISFRVRGNTLNGKEIETQSDLSAEGFNVVLSRMEK